jgi:hypothetical protein
MNPFSSSGDFDLLEKLSKMIEKKKDLKNERTNHIVQKLLRCVRRKAEVKLENN